MSFINNRPFTVLVRKAPKKDELVLTFSRKGEVFASAYLTLAKGRPFRGRVQTGSLDTYIQPSELLDRVSRARQIVFVPDPATKAVGEDLMALFSASSPVWAMPCKHCLLRGKLKFPRPPVKYGVERICSECGKAQFVKEAQARGWKVSQRTVDYLGKMLTKAGDYDAAWRAISPDYDPDRDAGLSLYDVIEKKPGPSHEMAVDDARGYFEDTGTGETLLTRLRGLGIISFLPVQASAIRSGLLQGQNLLIVSSTSSGKTLIAELAGIQRALKGHKFLYLTPLVALANLRYSEFRHKYEGLGMRTAIRVGVGRVRTGRELKLNTEVSAADIIVGTYEGIEQLLRAGRAKQLGDLGVVAIDEVQNIADQDRGCRLDGLIKKLRVIHPRAQFIYLSATVGNAEELARRLGAGLVLHDDRPVPLERHVIPISSPGQKIKLTVRLIRREYDSRSAEGYRGQTLVFTNSRRKCHQLSRALSTGAAPVRPYHSGLSYQDRREVEDSFLRQSIAGLVTTSALAAGVDLPASQVIFETLAMGMEWITASEFHQMLGRAGRLGYHGSGKAIMLIEPGRSYSRAERKTEDEVAFELLSSRIEPVVPSYTHEDLAEQVLADVSTFGMLSRDELERLQDYSIGFSSSIGPVIQEAIGGRLIRKKGDSFVITSTGRLTSSYFLTPDQSRAITRCVKKSSPILEIILSTEVFERAYVSERLQKEIENSMRRRASVRFFDSEVLEFLSRPRKVRSRWFREVLGRIMLDLLRCQCRGAPHCDCPPRKLSEQLLRLRLGGMEPRRISSELFKRYGVEVYPGDVLEYLDDAVRIAEAVSKFCEVLGRPRGAGRAEELARKIIG